MPRPVYCLVLVMVLSLAASSSEGPESASAEVVLQKVTFEGFESMSADVMKSLGSRLVGQTFRAAEASRDITYITKQFLIEHGYVHGVVAPLEVVPLQRGGIAATIPADEGPRFAFNTVTVSGAHVFPSSLIEGKFPVAEMRAGDFSGVPIAMEAVRRLYAAEGYTECFVIPFFGVDDDHQSFNLILDVNEGQQYHVGNVIILGLDSQQTERVFKRLPSGSNYSREKIEQIAIVYGTPLGLNALEVIESRVYPATHTVDVTLDFRSSLLRF